MVLSNKRITKVLIRLRGCAGWSAPVLSANPGGRFSRVEAQIDYDQSGAQQDLVHPLLKHCNRAFARDVG